MRRGFGFLGWLVIVFGLILLPYLLIGWRYEFKYVFMFVMGIAIYNFLRMFFGDSAITLGLTAIFFYYLVWKHFWTYSLVFWIYTLMGMGVLGTLGWGYITFASVTHQVFGGKKR